VRSRTRVLLRAEPHLRAFWTATFGFFSCFFSVFAPAALGVHLKKSVAEGGIGLTKEQAANAGAAAVGSTIIMRLLCGPMCDKFGARYTFIILLLAAIPGILGLQWIEDGVGLLYCRLVIGIGLASFVTCQVWCSQMFNKEIVGIANATAGGWGNLGGGVTILVMPLVYEAMLTTTDNNDVEKAWRRSFLLPLFMHAIAAVFILTGQDLPDGNYAALEKTGIKQKVKAGGVAKIGLSNINAWILAVTYGLCFGVELTMNNKVVAYFNSYYGLPPRMAGVLGACFGLMNLFARSWGGLLSDTMNKKFGMRGRIWAMWICQTLEGVMCIMMGLVTLDYPCPDDFPVGTPKIPGTWSHSPRYGETVVFTFNETIGKVKRCGSKSMQFSKMANPAMGWTTDANGVTALTPVPTNDIFIMVEDPDPACMHAAAPLALTMVCMIAFSIFVQMAEGLHFGIVPYVSRPALGVVSGMVGAGGNFGGVMGTRYIVGPNAPLDQGFIYLGIVIITLSLLMHGIYFPEHGGMLFPAGGLGSYDPQLIKPPADMRGADQLNYDKSKSKTKEAVADA
jgi:NNP family nitrate/nitrite transporter-like MFS transporter